MTARRPPPLNPGAKAWTPVEDEILRARYETEGAVAMARELGRSVFSINHRTQRLGLFTHRRWTPTDDARLRLIWGEYNLTETAARINRTTEATFVRAQVLGLPLGCPQGFEYLSAACKRTGYGVEQLRAIMGRAGMPIRFSMARPSGRPPRSCIVDPDQVDEAVARWLKTESLSAAAARHGITPGALEHWLRLSGRKLPPKPRRKKRWRIPTETIDEVVAARRAVVTLREAARAAGIPRGTLRSRLVAAGVPRPPGKLWLVNPADVAALMTRAA